MKLRVVALSEPDSAPGRDGTPETFYRRMRAEVDLDRPEGYVAVIDAAVGAGGPPINVQGYVGRMDRVLIRDRDGDGTMLAFTGPIEVAVQYEAFGNHFAPAIRAFLAQYGVGGRPPGRVIDDEDLRRAAGKLRRPTDESAAELLGVDPDTVNRQRARRPWREFLPVPAVE